MTSRPPRPASARPASASDKTIRELRFALDKTLSLTGAPVAVGLRNPPWQEAERSKRLAEENAKRAASAVAGGFASVRRDQRNEDDDEVTEEQLQQLPIPMTMTRFRVMMGQDPGRLHEDAAIAAARKQQEQEQREQRERGSTLPHVHYSSSVDAAVRMSDTRTGADAVGSSNSGSGSGRMFVTASVHAPVSPAVLSPAQRRQRPASAIHKQQVTLGSVMSGAGGGSGSGSGKARPSSALVATAGSAGGLMDRGTRGPLAASARARIREDLLPTHTKYMEELEREVKGELRCRAPAVCLLLLLPGLVCGPSPCRMLTHAYPIHSHSSPRPAAIHHRVDASRAHLVSLLDGMMEPMWRPSKSAVRGGVWQPAASGK